MYWTDENSTIDETENGKKRTCHSVGEKIWAGKKTPLMEYIYL